MTRPFAGSIPVFFLVSCAQESTTSLPDGPHYLAAIEAEDSESAVDACLRIRGEELESECLLHAAGKAARSGEEALVICGQIEHQGWRQACHFEVADAAGLVKAEAIAACAQAPAFSERCLSHAIVRHAGRVANRFSLQPSSSSASSAPSSPGLASTVAVWSA